MELVQRQTQQLTQQTLQSLALLQMSTVGIGGLCSGARPGEPYHRSGAAPLRAGSSPGSGALPPCEVAGGQRPSKSLLPALGRRGIGPAGPGGDGWRSGWNPSPIFSSARSSSSIWMSLPSSFCATCPPVWTRMGISASHWTSSPGLLASPKGGSPALWSYCAPWNPQVWGLPPSPSVWSFSCSASMRRAPPLPLFGLPGGAGQKTLSCHLRPSLHLSGGGPLRRTADPRAESPSRFHLRAPQRDLLYSAGYFDRRDGRTFHCPPAEQ